MIKLKEIDFDELNWRYRFNCPYMDGCCEPSLHLDEVNDLLNLWGVDCFLQLEFIFNYHECPIYVEIEKTLKENDRNE